jgi:hypothetical protein
MVADLKTRLRDLDRSLGEFDRRQTAAATTARSSTPC